MGKKKAATKARAKREQRSRADSPTSLPAAPPLGRLLHSDGCLVHRGLQNLGNTCYMNSMLQCLNVSFPFSDNLMKEQQQLNGAAAGSMSASLSSVFCGIRGVDESQAKGALNPKPLLSQVVSQFPWFRGKDQHDAHEFLRTLLGSISDEGEQQGKARGSKESGAKEPLDDGVMPFFSGRLCAVTLCWGCSRVSLRLDPFLDLPLHLPALVGQSVQAMGVTAAMASGVEEKLDEEPASEEETATKSRKGNKGGRRQTREPRVPAAVAKPQAGKKPLKGVWAAQRETEELRENTRLYISRLVERVVLMEEGVVVSPEVNDQEEPLVTYEVELKRTSKKTTPSWGFRWSDTANSEGQLVLAGIVEDSVVERWNLKRRALGDTELAICVGDILLEVNGACEHSEMKKALRGGDFVSLMFARSKRAQDGDLGRGVAESDGETERKAEAAVMREQQRRAFCEHAERCHEALPLPLQDIFGAEQARAGNPSTARIELECCMQHFSRVEALEDDCLPVYRCSHCTKLAEAEGEDSQNGGKGGAPVKTFASRRMWVWPLDLPPLLTLQLKRFRRYREKFEKSVASISLPLVLDMAQFVLSRAQLQRLEPFVEQGTDIQRCLKSAGEDNGGTPVLRYELYAICVHQGASMKGGHYVAYVNSGPSLEKEQWFSISDASHYKCDRSEVLKAEAYVAFYRREGTPAPEAVVEPIAEVASRERDGGDSASAASGD